MSVHLAVATACGCSPCALHGRQLLALCLMWQLAPSLRTTLCIGLVSGHIPHRPAHANSKACYRSGFAVRAHLGRGARALYMPDSTSPMCAMLSCVSASGGEAGVAAQGRRSPQSMLPCLGRRRLWCATDMQRAGVPAEKPFCVCQGCARLSNPTRPKCITQAQVGVGAAAHAFMDCKSCALVCSCAAAPPLGTENGAEWLLTLSQVHEHLLLFALWLAGGMGLGRRCWKLLSGIAPLLCASRRCHALLCLCHSFVLSAMGCSETCSPES